MGEKTNTPWYFELRNTVFLFIFKASKNGYMDIIKLLIKNGANKDATDKDGATSLHWGILITNNIPIFLFKKIICVNFRKNI